VITVVKFEAPGLVDRAVREGYSRAAQLQHLGDGLMGDATERDDDAKVWQAVDRGREELPAIVDLQGQRLVLRRHAAHRIADQAIDQPQAVIGARLVAAPRETVFEQRRVEQVAGIVAGERPPGPVGAL
jgi:hypothetical protein